MERSKYELGFVILNYNTAKETIDCVSSIKNRIDTRNYIIIIVDNASYDDSYNILVNKYHSDPKIRILKNAENLGFASGNNKGIIVAKNEYNCSFICVLNSDTMIIQDDFYSSILRDYKEYEFSVLGPNILTPNNVQCNPLGRHLITLRETKKKIISLKIQIILNCLGIDELLRKVVCSRRKAERKLDAKDYHIDVKLHGCCLIFSPIYLENYDGFDEGTFLYLEEDLLYLHMMIDSNRTLYSPIVKILHLEDASTNKIAKGKKKRKFVLQQHLKSMQIIQEYICKWRNYEKQS